MPLHFLKSYFFGRRLNRRSFQSRLVAIAAATAAAVFTFPAHGCRSRAATSPPNGGEGIRNAAAPTVSAEASPLAPDTAGPSLFRDIAASAGVEFLQTNGDDEGKFLMIETTPGGCAFFDYDNDGLLDIFLVQSGAVPGSQLQKTRPSCKLFRNNGDRKFTDVTASTGLERDLGYAQGVAVGDYDNDGFDDLFVTSYDGCYLFHNEKGLRFSDVSVQKGVAEKGKGRWATSAAFGDYDNDGRLDLIVLHYIPWSPRTDKACRDSKGRKNYCSPEVYGSETPTLYRNRGGDDPFEDVTSRSGISQVKGRGLAVIWTDYDQDGQQDLYIANDLQPNQLARNMGNGKFVEQGLELGLAYGPDGDTLSGMGIAPGDFENIGWESFVITNFSGQPNTLYRALGKGAFEDATYRSGVGQPTIPFLAFGVEFLDYDRDSWRDLVFGNGHIDPYVAESAVNVTYRQPKLLLRNLGNTRFERITAGLGDMAKPKVTRGLATGDFDNDGRVDVLANNHNDRAELLHNESEDTNHWISLRLEGVRSNRDGLGAVVRITTVGGKRYFAQCRLGSSYASVSDKRLFFGLGRAEKVDSIEVRWPGGRNDTYRGPGLTADTFYFIREGAPRPERDPRLYSGRTIPK